MNALAYRYAQELDVPMSAGSDIHFFYDGHKGGMSFSRRLDSIEDYVQAFKKREGIPVVLDDGRVQRVDEIEGYITPVHGPTFKVVTGT